MKMNNSDKDEQKIGPFTKHTFQYRNKFIRQDINLLKMRTRCNTNNLFNCKQQ